MCNAYKIGVSMPYLICDKCDGYYKLHEGENINDFHSCECGGKLRSIKIHNEEPACKENEHRSIKLFFKPFSSSSFNFIILSIISISLLIWPSSATLIMNFSPLISVMLFVVLAFKFILNEDTNNSVIKFFVEKYVFLIIPLIILFTGTLVNRALLILLK